MNPEQTQQPPDGLNITVIKKTLGAHEPRIEPSHSSINRAAVAMILRDTADRGLEMLFVKRAEHPLDPWSGHMAFPGGREKSGDSTLADVARRETLEEVGVALVPAMRIGRLDDLGGGRLADLRMSVSSFVFHISGPAELRLNYEIADALWTPLDWLGRRENVRPYSWPGAPRSRPFPSFALREGYTIWGMTYRIVHGFFALHGVELPLDREDAGNTE